MLSDNLVSLRALETTDTISLFDLENLSDFWRTSSTLAPYSHRNIMRYIETYEADPFHSGELRLAIETSAGKQTVGFIDLYNVEVRHRRACIGIIIAPDRQRNGYACAALRLIEKYCNDHLCLHQLLAAVPSDNMPSIKLFDKCGFKHIATLPHYISAGGSEYVDAIVMNKIL